MVETANVMFLGDSGDSNPQNMNPTNVKPKDVQPKNVKPEDVKPENIPKDLKSKDIQPKLTINTEEAKSTISKLKEKLRAIFKSTKGSSRSHNAVEANWLATKFNSVTVQGRANVAVASLAFWTGLMYWVFKKPSGQKGIVEDPGKK